jgi:cytochrome c-type biogenesis protein CcmE
MATRQQTAVRILVSAVVVVGAFSMLFFAMAQKDALFYKHVDEVMTSPDQWYGKHMQLHGFVDGTVMQRPNTLEYRFSIKNGASMVPAMYTGVVPDTFKEGSEVVLKGELARDGFHVERDGIMAKCPSKYQPADGAASNARGGH